MLHCGNARTLLRRSKGHINVIHKEMEPDMTAAATNIDLSSHSTQSAPSRGRFDLSVSREEVQFATLALAILAAWVGAVAAFGFAGLITGALTMVAVMFVMLVIISRG